MQNETYRKAVIEAIRKLDTTYEEVFDAMLGVMVAGEWSEWDQQMEEGDEVFFTEEMFETSDDANVQRLLKLVMAIRKTMHKLANLNCISKEDLEAAEDTEI